MTVARKQRSQEGWRRKAVARSRLLKARNRRIRSLEDRYARKAEQYDAEERGRLAAEARAAKAEARIAELEAKPLLNMTIQINIRIVAVMVFVLGIVSARAVPRIIQLFSVAWGVGVRRIPHHSSVINWICRAGLGQLQSVVPWKERPWVAIIDTSISYAQQKLLIVLRAPLDHFANSAKALSLTDVECIGIEIADTWNGERVLGALTRIFSDAGAPAAIIKDGGGDIGAGTKRWCDAQSGYVAIVRDIGHVIANELKRVYKRNPVLDEFLKLVNSIRARLCQTELAVYRPPILRTKGRFQSISRIAAWANRILDLTGGRGRAEEDGLLARVRAAFKGLSTKRWLITRLARDCLAANELMELLKNRGLNQETYREAKAIIMKLPAKKGIRQRLLKWLQQHIQIQCRLGIGQIPLIVSSDVIECLMGVIKMIIERNPLPEFGRMALAVPLLCGQQTSDTIREGIARCSHADLKKYLRENVNNTIRKQKCRLDTEIMQKHVPKPVQAQAP